MVFRCFERDKPLQTFPTWTAVRVRRSVRVLRHYSRCGIRKTKKITQNSVEQRIQNQAKSDSESIFGIPLLGAPPAPAGLVLVLNFVIEISRIIGRVGDNYRLMYCNRGPEEVLECASVFR